MFATLTTRLRARFTAASPAPAPTPSTEPTSVPAPTVTRTVKSAPAPLRAPSEPRTERILQIVESTDTAVGFSEIVEVLHAEGDRVTPAGVGATLTHLKRHGRIDHVARGRWAARIDPTLPRTERIAAVLARSPEPTSIGEVYEQIVQAGDDTGREIVNATLWYLKGKGRAANPSRGMWVAA